MSQQSLTLPPQLLYRTAFVEHLEGPIDILDTQGEIGCSRYG